MVAEYDLRVETVELADFLLIAEAVLGVPAQELHHATKVGLAESALAAPFASFGGEDFYPSTAEKAAVLCSRIVRNHALPDGNKRTALVVMLDFIERNGAKWTAPSGEQDEMAAVIEDLAAGTLSEVDFTDWVRERIATDESSV
jgi:death-on-curing protein